MDDHLDDRSRDLPPSRVHTTREPDQRPLPRPVAAVREHDEEIRRIAVDPEDRLAFRVGVNVLSLILIGLAVYLVWRNFFA